mmetsp:Transcript_6281/g.9775  ORF Transcript_6281/g.9775 Transcript_6281/m.9775 type:complete len:89 (+) Transcript_6281:24-290(+)
MDITPVFTRFWTSKHHAHKPSGMEADELDPRFAVERKCQPKVKGYLDLYNACVQRIEGKKDVDCSGTYFDYLMEMDKCAAAEIFHSLK